MSTKNHFEYVTRKNPETGGVSSYEVRRNIFISYLHSDPSTFVLREYVAKRIVQEYDVAVWYVIDEKFDDPDEIKDLISKCDGVVLLLSNKKIFSSDFVWDSEIKTAKELEKGNLIPIAFDIPEESYKDVEKKIGCKVDIINAPTKEIRKALKNGKWNDYTTYRIQEINISTGDKLTIFDKRLINAIEKHVIDKGFALTVDQYRKGHLTYVTKSDPKAGEKQSPEEKRKVFISYRHPDSKNFAVRDYVVNKILNLADVAVWYDANLTAGYNYDNEINDAISECDAFVLLLTSKILDSDYVWDKEVAAAKEYRKNFIIIAFDATEKECYCALERIGRDIDIINAPDYMAQASQKAGKKNKKILEFDWLFDQLRQQIDRSHAGESLRDFNERLKNELERYVVNRDLVVLINKVFASGDDASLSDLTAEEKQYLMGLGYLYGVGTEKDEKKALEILKRLADSGENDVKGLAAYELSGYYLKFGKRAASRSTLFNSDVSDAETQADKYVRISAKCGNVSAKTRLGYFLYTGYGAERDKDEGYRWLKEAADKGDIDAMNTLGEINYNGITYRQKPDEREKNSSTGKKALLLAGAVLITGGANIITRGVVNMAAAGAAKYLYGCSIYVNPDKKEAAKWFIAAAEAGDPGAMSRIAFMYRDGDGVGKNNEEAVKWFSRAADNGDTTAMVILGNMYYNGGNGLSQDSKQAAYCFEKAANKGEPIAVYNLGILYYNGYGVDQSKDRAYELFKTAAGKGDKDALCILGLMHYEKQEYQEAAEWYQKAADAGIPEAMSELGMMYHNGYGVEQDDSKAIDWLEKAERNGASNAGERLDSIRPEAIGAENDEVRQYLEAADKGDTDAMLALGNVYFNGDGVEANYNRAIDWYTRAANAGNSSAMCSLGNVYYSGEKVERDVESGLYWFTKAANAGNILAMCSLGILYILGDEEVEMDYKKAYFFLSKAAYEGLPYAMYALGIIYEQGYGVVKNLQTAADWYTKAADAGDADAMLELGRMYEQGTGVRKDLVKAGQLYAEAAEAGNEDAAAELKRIRSNPKVSAALDAAPFKLLLKSAKSGDASAMRSLGDMYYTGDGIDKNYKKAVKWYTKAANAGDVDTMKYLAAMYFNGDGIKQDNKAAVKWYTKAANAGDVDTMVRLGKMYYSGNGVKVNKSRAVKWYTKAAVAGDVNTMVTLGNMYYAGNGIFQSKFIASEWYTQAANAGNVQSMITLGRMYYNGDGIIRDKSKAVGWYIKAANAGDVKSMLITGKAYYYGNGVYINKSVAFKWLTQAANAGEMDATFLLGKMYYNGDGVKKDRYEAFRQLRRAADKGYVEANLLLGLMYYEGDGTSRDKHKAFTNLSIAAKNGYTTPDSMLYMGRMYYYGDGVTQNKMEGKNWLSKATQSGSGTASSELQRILEQEKAAARDQQSLAVTTQTNTNAANNDSSGSCLPILLIIAGVFFAPAGIGVIMIIIGIIWLLSD